jgi:transcription antitermination factor NusG
MAHWFAVRTSVRWEMRACSELSQRGIETWLPLCHVRHKWSDRTKIVDQPIFPGYLFSRFDLGDRIRVLETPGVKQILGVGPSPVAISQSEIDNLKTLVDAKPLLVPWPYLRAGQRMRIDRGPLAGVEGFVLRAEQGALSIVVSVDLLQRSVATQIDRDCVGSVD